MTKFLEGKSLAIRWYMLLKPVAGEPKGPIASPLLPCPIPSQTNKEVWAGWIPTMSLQESIRLLSGYTKGQEYGQPAPNYFTWEADVANCFVKDTHALERASCKGMSWNVSVLAVFGCQHDACYPQASFYHCTWKTCKEKFLNYLKIFQSISVGFELISWKT